MLMTFPINSLVIRVAAVRGFKLHARQQGQLIHGEAINMQPSIQPWQWPGRISGK
jgi:hypothetical protein